MAQGMEAICTSAYLYHSSMKQGPKWMIAGCVLVLLVACHPRDDRRIDLLGNTVQAIARERQQQADLAYRQVEDRWFAPAYRYHALFWIDKVKALKYHTLSVTQYLDNLQDSVQSGMITPDKVFDPAHGGACLFSRLRQYKTSLLTILDTSCYQEKGQAFRETMQRDLVGFRRYLPLLAGDTATDQSAFQQTWCADRQSPCTKKRIVMLLKMLKSEVSSCHQEMSTYIRSWIPTTSCGYWKPAPIAFISPQQLRVGQTLTVYAGAGYTNTSNGIRIKVDTTLTLIDHSGWAECKIPVQGIPGKYTLPVHFEYTEYGQIHTQTRLVEYLIKP